VEIQERFAQERLATLTPHLRTRAAHELELLRQSALYQELNGLPEKQLLREVPYLRALDERTVEDGKIDFLHTRDGRNWRVLDWKTDADPTPELLLRKYAPQLLSYRYAARAHGLIIESVYLYATASGQLIHVA
jgi:ATP-dependent exoDNAse (exonuclease V) beta subunit